MFPLENYHLSTLMFLLLLISLLLNELIVTIDCIKLVKVKVPDEVTKGSDVELKCIYDLEGNPLYALQWFFEKGEFYRYAPNSNPNVITFNVTGEKVNKKKSHQGNIVLSNVGVNSTGRYKCEITAAITYRTDGDEHFMRVSANSASSLWALPLSSSSFSSSSWLTIGSFLLMLMKFFPTATIALTSQLL